MENKYVTRILRRSVKAAAFVGFLHQLAMRGQRPQRREQQTIARLHSRVPVTPAAVLSSSSTMVLSASSLSRRKRTTSRRYSILAVTCR